MNQKWLKENAVFLITVGILYTLFGLVFQLLSGNRTPINGISIPWEFIWLAVVISYTLAGITGTGKNERALKMFLGKMPMPKDAEIPPLSLAFVPPGLFRLELMPVELQQIELPGEPEQIWRHQDANGKELPLGIGSGDGKTSIPPPKKRGKNKEGKEIEEELEWVHPVRILFNRKNPDKEPLEGMEVFDGVSTFQKSSPAEKGGKDPTQERVTAEVSGVLQWRVRGIASFLRNYETFENARKLLGDIAITEMTSALLKGTPDRAQINQDLLGHQILRTIREQVGHEVGMTTILDESQLPLEADLKLTTDPEDKTCYYVDKTDKEEKKIYTQLGHPKGRTIRCRRGVEIMLFQLKPLVFSQDYNRSIQEIPRAEAEAQANARRGRGEKDRMAHLRKEANKPGGEMLLKLEQLKTIGETFGKQDKTVLVDSSNPIAALLGTMAAGGHLLASPNNKLIPLSPPTSP